MKLHCRTTLCNNGALAGFHADDESPRADVIKSISCAITTGMRQWLILVFDLLRNGSLTPVAFLCGERMGGYRGKPHG